MDNLLMYYRVVDLQYLIVICLELNLNCEGIEVFIVSLYFVIGMYDN